MTAGSCPLGYWLRTRGQRRARSQRKGPLKGRSHGGGGRVWMGCCLGSAGPGGTQGDQTQRLWGSQGKPSPLRGSDLLTLRLKCGQWDSAWVPSLRHTLRTQAEPEAMGPLQSQNRAPGREGAPPGAGLGGVREEGWPWSAVFLCSGRGAWEIKGHLPPPARLPASLQSGPQAPLTWPRWQPLWVTVAQQRCQPQARRPASWTRCRRLLLWGCWALSCLSLLVGPD